MMIKGKKGASILFIIFELLIVLIVVFSLVKAAKIYGSSEGTQKIILSKDLKMMVDTLVASPGDLTVEYPGNVFDYQIHLSQSSVLVALASEDEGHGVQDIFFLPKGYEATGSVIESNRVCLTKQGSNILLTNCAE
jgi:hypothetical protein